MAIGSLPPVTNEIQANSGQPGKTLAQQTPAGSLLDVQAAAAEPAVAIVPETTLIEKAVAEALGRQGGLAPLYATLAELADAPDLPDAVKAAINQVLAFRLGDGNVTPERVAEAIRSSGLFHEAVAAGRMAAVLPPAVRQALGGLPEERRQATARPSISASSLATPSSSAWLVATTASASPANAGSLSQNTEASLQGGSRSPGPMTVTSPAGTPPSPAGNSAGPVSVAPGAPAASSANAPPTAPASLATGTLTPSTGAAVSAQPIAGGEALPTTSATVGVAASQSGPTASAPALPAAALALEGAPASPSQQVPPSDVDARAPTPLSAGGAGGVPSSPPAASTPGGAAPGQSGGAQPTSGAMVPMPPPEVRASNADADGPSPSPSPATPQSGSGGAATSARTFAPWTPGRPLNPQAPPAATSASPGAPPAAGHLGPPQSAHPTGPEPPLPRSVGDKALFVPSTVDSLPNTAPAVLPRVSAGPAATPPNAPGAPAQPSAGQPVAEAASSQPGPEPKIVAGPGNVGSPQAPQPARPVSTVPGEPIANPERRPVASPAAATPPQAAANVAMAGIDIKGALGILRHELLAWLGRNADVMASIAGDDGGAASVNRPPPPRKGGPVRGQPAMQVVDGDQAEAGTTEALAGRALGEAERSLSRVFLHQAATSESRDAKGAQTTQALMFEIPIAGPNGTSIAQLRIERDDHPPAEPGAKPRKVFQVDIAFDIVPLGPVAVRIGLMDGRRVAVGVWCESDDGFVRMEAERENIVLGLEQEGMVVAGLDLHRGHPPEGREDTTVAASHRLDLQL